MSARSFSICKIASSHRELEYLCVTRHRMSEESCRQDNAGFNRVTSGFNGNPKAIGLALNDVTVNNNFGVEQGNKGGWSAMLPKEKHQGLTGWGAFKSEQLTRNQ